MQMFFVEIREVHVLVERFWDFCKYIRWELCKNYGIWYKRCENNFSLCRGCELQNELRTTGLHE